MLLKDEVKKITSAIQIESSSKAVAATEVSIRQSELQTIERSCQKLKVQTEALLQAHAGIKLFEEEAFAAGRGTYAHFQAVNSQ